MADAILEECGDDRAAHACECDDRDEDDALDIGESEVAHKDTCERDDDCHCNAVEERAQQQ